MAVAKKQQRHYYTYEDLASLPQGTRAEIIDGELLVALSSPSTRHQRIVKRLSSQLETYLLGKTCEVFLSPLDVVLWDVEDGDDETSVVQPDVFVVCDPGKITEKGCKGAPDLVIEVLSPNNRHMEVLTKYKLYERAGVKEYWVVDPDDGVIMVNLLENGRYACHNYEASAAISVSVLEGCTIALKDIFGDISKPSDAQ